MKEKITLTYSGNIPETEMDKRNSIIDAINKRNFILKKEAAFLLSFDKKYRVCNTCGKSFREANLWPLAKCNNRYGEAIDCGLHSNCLYCELFGILNEDISNK